MCAGRQAAARLGTRSAGACGRGRRRSCRHRRFAKPGNQGKGLGKGDRELVAAAKVNGQATVPLLIATQPGNAGAVVSQLAKYGATVTDQSDQFGYVIADVPTDKASRCEGRRHPRGERGQGRSGVVPDSLGEGRYAGQRRRRPPTSARRTRTCRPTASGRRIRRCASDVRRSRRQGRHRRHGRRPRPARAPDGPRPDGKPVAKIYDWTTQTSNRLSDPANGDPTWVPRRRSPSTATARTSRPTRASTSCRRRSRARPTSLSSGFSSRAIRASAASSGATSTRTATRRTPSVSSKTRRPGRSGSTSTERQLPRRRRDAGLRGQP